MIIRKFRYKNGMDSLADSGNFESCSIPSDTPVRKMNRLFIGHSHVHDSFYAIPVKSGNRF